MLYIKIKIFCVKLCGNEVKLERDIKGNNYRILKDTTTNQVLSSYRYDMNRTQNYVAQYTMGFGEIDIEKYRFCNIK